MISIECYSCGHVLDAITPRGDDVHVPSVTHSPNEAVFSYLFNLMKSGAGDTDR